MKVAIITCYKYPDYIRAVTIRAAAERLGCEVIVVKNRHKNTLRYLEVLVNVIKTRFGSHPDVYFVTFRAYEVLPAIRLLSLGKPLIYDEFINAYEWLVLEHKKLPGGSVAAKVFLRLYSILINTAQVITTDTVSHADLSAQLTGVAREKFVPLIVSSDETTFYPAKSEKHLQENEPLKVFYYGNMLKLHGLPIVLEAARRLVGKPISFEIIGGGKKTKEVCENAKLQGVNIVHTPWLAYEKLPEAIAAADICLAGPYGGTLQSQYVVTGKAYQFLSMAKPIIVGQNYESHIFTDKENALIVPQDNSEALAEKLDWAIKNRDKLLAIGKSGRKLYKRELSHEKLEKQVGALLSRFCANNT